LSLIRIGLTESYLECLEEELVGLEWLVRQGVVRKGDAIALLHTAHGSTSLRAPFAMEILAVNGDLAQDPRLLRDSPYYEGWLAEVRRRT
jgi:glycine cleavage system H protein